jgi:hypothetical protein
MSIHPFTRQIVGWHPRPASRDACLVNLTKAIEALRYDLSVFV